MPPSNYKTKTLAKSFISRYLTRAKFHGNQSIAHTLLIFLKGRDFLERRTRNVTHLRREMSTRKAASQWNEEYLAFQQHELRGHSSVRVWKRHVFCATLKWIVKWGTQESHLKKSTETLEQTCNYKKIPFSSLNLPSLSFSFFFFGWSFCFVRLPTDFFFSSTGSTGVKNMVIHVLEWTQWTK